MFIVMCERSGGPSGFAQTELKSNGKVQEFTTRDEAQAKADFLNKSMNHVYAVAQYRYWVEER